MSKLEQFAAYAAAFEQTFVDDDWQRLEQYFAADAVYLPGDGSIARGRDAVIQALRDSVNALDRKFETRTLGEIPQILEQGAALEFPWSLTLRTAGLPVLAISGREHIAYADHLIVRMEDVFDDGVAEAIADWMAQYDGDSATAD